VRIAHALQGYIAEIDAQDHHICFRVRCRMCYSVMSFMTSRPQQGCETKVPAGCRGCAGDTPISTFGLGPITLLTHTLSRTNQETTSDLRRQLQEDYPTCCTPKPMKPTLGFPVVPLV
jgi:hypothetical protein